VGGRGGRCPCVCFDKVARHSNAAHVLPVLNKVKERGAANMTHTKSVQWNGPSVWVLIAC